MVGDFLWPLFPFGMAFGMVQTASSHATRDSALAHRGITAGMAAAGAGAILTCAQLALGAVGTSRAERALGHSTGAQSLRRKLRQQRKLAWVSALIYGISGACTCVLITYRGARPVCGTIFSFLAFFGLSAMIFPC